MSYSRMKKFGGAPTYIGRKIRMRRNLIYVTATLGFIGVMVSALLPYLYIQAVTASSRDYAPASLPRAETALVLGARVYPDGSLSPILRDRVDAATALYKTGKVKRLLMSGDNSTPHYDEVTAMAHYAETSGVPSGAIDLDYAGFNTYASCYRARSVFGPTQVIVVTQSYHLPRAIYLCDHLGVAAVGSGVPDFSHYPDLRYPYTVREILAATKAMFDIDVTHPKPTFPH